MSTTLAHHSSAGFEPDLVLGQLQYTGLFGFGPVSGCLTV
jgi:hypothetical protein